MLSWQQALALGLLLLLTAAVLRLAGVVLPALLARLVTEGGRVALLYAAWQLLLDLVVRSTAGAVEHARSVQHAEQVVHLPAEVRLQRWLLHHPGWGAAADTWYGAAHFTVLLLLLLWLVALHPPAWPRWRALLVLHTAVCALLQAVPVAPPRALPDQLDVARLLGGSVYAGDPLRAAGQVAAMPSVHVAWSLFVAAAVLRVGRSRWRWLIVLHPLVTVLVVVATGNHWWLDGAAGAGVLAAAALALGLPRRGERRHRVAAGPLRVEGA